MISSEKPTTQIPHIIPKRLEEVVPCNIYLGCHSIRSFHRRSIVEFNSTYQSVGLIFNSRLVRRFLGGRVHQIVSESDDDENPGPDGGENGVGTRDVGLSLGPRFFGGGLRPGISRLQIRDDGGQSLESLGPLSVEKA